MLSQDAFAGTPMRFIDEFENLLDREVVQVNGNSAHDIYRFPEAEASIVRGFNR